MVCQICYNLEYKDKIQNTDTKIKNSNNLFTIYIIKDIFPQTKNVKSVFRLLCSQGNLLKNYTLFGRLKQFSVVFIMPYLMHHPVILWNSPSMHSLNKGNNAYCNLSCNVLACLLNKQKEQYTESEIWPY